MLSSRMRAIVSRHGASFPAAIVIFARVVGMLAGPVSASEPSSLPYVPTTVLIPGSTADLCLPDSQNASHDIAYIITPNAGGDSVDLLSLNISSTLEASSVKTQTLTSGLPFYDGNTTATGFIPSLAADGTIVVYAGDCSSDNDFAIWTYNTSSESDSSWTRHSVSDNAGADIQAGPYLLGGGLSFSEILQPTVSPALIYSYGGMCPNSSDVESLSSWVPYANYSNQMLRLSPVSKVSSSTSPGTISYKVEAVSSKVPPVAEAGFTLTRLPPSISNISGTVSQQVNSVLLGGHTQTAFINISTAAIWSLPEESWSYVAISGPSSVSTEGELTKKKDLQKSRRSSLSTTVDSRSGHTAILNEEGTALIILGGWVGDISQAADPQLAVLDLGDTNFGQWSWTIPSQQPSGTGIYGHGAALLPGNVMMVSGGYAIASSDSGSFKKRRELGTTGSAAMFFNITSMSWSDSYMNPSPPASGATGGMASGSLPKSTQVSLGVGLGVGLAALITILAVSIWCWRRRQKRRHLNRDKAIEALHRGARPLHGEDDEMLEQDDPLSPHAFYYTGGHDPYMRNGGPGAYESLSGSRSYPSCAPEMAEPTGAQRPLPIRRPAPRVARGLYQPTSTGIIGSSRQNAIHPILEGDEDLETTIHGDISPARDEETDHDNPFVTPAQTPSALAPGAVIFSHPGNRSNTPSPERSEAPPIPPQGKHQHKEVQDWVSDIDASDALITARIQPHNTTVKHHIAGSRNSPTRRGSIRNPFATTDSDEARTDSNLSDSNYSFIASRSDSTRSHHRLSAHLYSVATGSAAAATGAAGPRGNGEAPGSSDSSSTGNTFQTAKSMTAFQAAGPTLLLGKPRRIDTDLADGMDIEPLTPGSPSKNRFRRSWLGSLKRVFSSDPEGPTSSNPEDSPTRSGGESSDYEPQPQIGLGSFRCTLLKRKQGRQAWEVGGGESGEPSAAAAALAAAATEGREQQDDWDIERAVEQRLVQIMFTVPKERLRVVNGDAAEIDREEEVVVVIDPRKEDRNDGDERDERDDRENDNEGDEPGETSSFIIVDPEKKQQKREQMQEKSLSPDLIKTPDSQALLNVPHLQHNDDDDRRGTPSRSPSPAVIHTAEEIRYKRSKGKVLEMVEDLEARSRSNSSKGKGSKV